MWMLIFGLLLGFTLGTFDILWAIAERLPVDEVAELRRGLRKGAARSVKSAKVAIEGAYGISNGKHN